MNNKIILVLCLGLLTAACGTTDTKQSGAAVEDRGDSSGGARDSGGATTYGAGREDPYAMSELDDPQNLLSQRIIYFGYDESEIQPQYRELIDAHARYLAAHPDKVISLEGHADERGSREYNLALGERRALAVKRQMTLLGAASSQIRTVSYGEERPVEEGHDEYSWSQNRRVEIVY